MKILNIDFTQKPRLLINGLEYNFNQRINATDHVFNNAGSSINLADVYPISYTDEEIRTKPFKIPKYSLGELYFGDQLFYFGILKLQNSGSLNINKLKKISVTISSLKEFLIHEPMDFPVLNKYSEYVVDKIIQKLNIPYVVKGNMSFTNNQIIKSYNTKDMSAYDTLRYIERHTNSTLFIVFNSANKNIEITFQSNSSVSNGATGNIGVEIPFTTEENIQTFSDLYDLIDFTWEENANQDANTIRVESEKSLSNRPRTIEVDLSLNQTQIVTPFPIGKIDVNNTKYLNPDGTIKRKILITTQEEADAGKPSDLAYTQNSQTITINQRLITQNPNGKLIVSYFPLIRQNIDFEDSNDQQRVANQLKTNKGKLFRYEKYNDVTELEDLISQGQTLLEIGIANKVELKLSSRNPIWDIGQYVTFNGNDDYSDFVGEYIVKDAMVDFVLDEAKGVRLATFTYTLGNLKQIENSFNYQDSQVYRDNPILSTASVAVDVTETITETIKLQSNNLIRECEDISDNPNEFDYDLDFNIEIDTTDGQGNDLAKYRILQV